MFARLALSPVEGTQLSAWTSSFSSNHAVMDWVRESGSLLGYPAILFLHTIGLATVAGLNGAIICGCWGRIPDPSSR